MRFTIGIVGRDSNVHTGCFEDVTNALASALRQAGHEVVPFGPDQGRLIIFGCNKIAEKVHDIPADTIIFNTEQIAATNVEWQLRAFRLYRERGIIIWDYSEANARKLREAEMRVVMCPIGYLPSMRRTAITDYRGAEDIDVLFYGSTNRQRIEVFKAIEATGLNLVVIHPNGEFEGKRFVGLYGEERDRIIARAKIVINLHFYRKAVFEIFRVSHLLANGKCVVTEDGGQDEGLEEFARRACRYVSPQEVATACRELVADEAARRAQAERGRAEFQKLDFVENVRRALEASS